MATFTQAAKGPKKFAELGFANEQILDLLLIHAFVEAGLKGHTAGEVIQIDNRIFSTVTTASEDRPRSKTAAGCMATKISVVVERRIRLMANCFPRRKIGLLASKTGLGVPDFLRGRLTE